MIHSLGYFWNSASQPCSVSDPTLLRFTSLIPARAIVQVKIGKYKEDHPCNPQSLKILAGDDPSHLEEVLDINLKNDSSAETGDLRHSARVWTGHMSKENLWDLGRERNVIVSFPHVTELEPRPTPNVTKSAICSEIRQVGSVDDDP